jgi:hypothetical protein
MDVICPNCQKKLSLQDQYAGQLVRCPLCQGMFQAPSLPSYTPPPPPPPPLAPQPPGVANAPAPAPTPPLETPGFVEEAPAPLPPGDYTKDCTCHLRADILVWIGPACLVLLFVLSFFTWKGHNLWQGEFEFVMVYVFALILAMPLSIVGMLMEMRIIPAPDNIRAFLVWRSVVLGALVLIPWLVLTVLYLRMLFAGAPMGIAMKLGYRLLLIALVAFVLEFWLVRRRAKNLPPPQFTMRW